MHVNRRKILLGATASLIPGTSNAWIHRGSPPQGITLNDVPAAGAVFNRAQGSTSGRPTLSGTYTGGAPSPEAQVRLVSDSSIVAPWTPLTNLTQSNGVWSGKGPLVAQSSNLIYKFEVRSGINHSISAVGSNAWGIGINFIMVGQSNENTLAATGDGSIPMVAGAYHITRDGNIITDYTLASFSNALFGNGLTTILNDLVTASGVCVCALNMGWNATNIDGDAGGLWDSFMPGAVAMWLGGDFEFIHWNGGENQFQYSAATLTESVYLDWFVTLQNKAKALTGRTVMPVYVSSIGRNTTTANGVQNWPLQQRTYIDAANCLNDFHFVCNNMDQTTVDGTHKDVASCLREGQRVGQSILFLKGISATPVSPWFITDATITNATTTRITMVHSAGTDFTPTTGITGFEVSGDGGATWVTPSAAVRFDATHIDLTHSSFNTALRIIRYQWDSEPDISACVKDNSAIQSPLNYTPVVMRCSNSTVPFPVIQVASNKNLVNGGGATFNSAEQLISAKNGDLLILNLAMGGSSLPPNTITITPAGGSTINLTKVVGTTSNGGSIWQAVLGADITFGVKCTVLASWAVGVFTNVGFMIYVVPGAQLSSTTATGSAVATPATSPTAPSLTLNTSAGGFVISNCVTQNAPGTPARSDVVQITGANGFTNDSPWAGSIVSPIFGFGASSNNAANASTSVSLNYEGTSGTGTLVAASWR